MAFQNLKTASQKDGERLFTGACSDGTKRNGFKLAESRFRFDFRKKFFTVRVMRPIKRFPRDTVVSVGLFKGRLDGTLRNLVWWKMSLPNTVGLE